MNIRPLIIVNARYPSISGGYRRLYEVLKRGKMEGIDYIILTDTSSYRNYVHMFPDFKEILDGYKSYFVDSQKIKAISPHLPRVFKAVTTYGDFFTSAASIAKIVREEDVDLVVGPSEGTQMVWTSHFSGRMSHKPWTALFQLAQPIFEPTPELGPVNPFNVLKHVSQKEFAREITLLSKFGFSLELLGLLKTAEKSLILTVSRSVCEEIGRLDPEIKFHVITPGNGIDLAKFGTKQSLSSPYDAIFFSRLVPEKGICDLPEIWKLVTQKFPKARLAVAGIVEDPRFVEEFQMKISRYDLTKNVVYLGPQDKDSIFDLVKSSKLTIYPSFFDSFGLVILESLACGAPVIAYDILAVRYNFCKCKAVLRCPIGDTSSIAKNLIFLLENEDLRTKLSKEAKEYSSNFDWKKVVRAEKEAYFNVIKWFNFR
jgi:glycosyltransferase involved in cell wall biosynthesis